MTPTVRHAGLAALALAAAMAVPVYAQTIPAPTPAPAAPAAAALKLSDIVLDFEARGYRVLEVETKRGWTKVEAINPAGQKIEADVDPVTGKTVKEELDL